MIDVAIDLNLHHGGPSDGLSTRLYVYNWHIYPLADGGIAIMANRTEKVPYAEDIFFSNNTIITAAPRAMRDRLIEWPQYSVQGLIIYR